MEFQLVFAVWLSLCITQIHSSYDEIAKGYDEKSIDDGLSTKHATIECTESHSFADFISMCNLTRFPKEISNTSPWIPTGYSYRPDVNGLHMEIEHFNAYLKATPAEHSLRIQVVKRIESVVLELWPTARVQVFGSYRSGMFSPNSDIDLNISKGRDPFSLRMFQSKLLNNNIAESHSIVLLERTRVPIIKFTDRASKLNVDITFNSYDGIEKIDLINEYKRRHPVMPKLVMVLKQFLLLHDLNDLYSGGISSFSLYLMCVSFLQLQPVDKVGENANLGVLLLGFLELYGRKFDYDKSCIRITNGGQYLPKEEALRVMIHEHRTQFLCIEDPLNPWINTARSSYYLPNVKCAFESAFTLLSNAMLFMQSGNGCSRHNSALSRIIQVTTKLLEHRNWVRKTFEQTRN